MEGSASASARFFSGKNIKIEPGDMGVMLNVTMPDGMSYKNVEPRRYFPISDINKYVSIVKLEEDEKGKTKEIELLVIRELSNLDEASRDALEKALARFYMIPKILDICDSKSLYGVLQWKVKTDRGDFSFDIRDLYSSIKQLPDGRVLIIDASDNRYEISDYRTLSKKGQGVLLGYL